MRTFLILGCAAIAAGAAGFATFRYVTKTPAPVEKRKNEPKPGVVSTPRVLADAIVDDLHPHLAARFGTVPTDQRFGIERAPEQYHIQDGVINPKAAHDWEKEARKEEGKKFKPLGADQLPTKDEEGLITQLRDKGFNFEVYTVGLGAPYSDQNAQEYARLRGPVGDLQNAPDEKVFDEVQQVGIAVNKAEADSLDSASQDGKIFFKAKSIRMTEERCAKCHEGVKVGQKVGAIVYRYWPRA